MKEQNLIILLLGIVASAIALYPIISSYFSSNAQLTLPQNITLIDNMQFEIKELQISSQSLYLIAYLEFIFILILYVIIVNILFTRKK